MFWYLIYSSKSLLYTMQVNFLVKDTIYTKINSLVYTKINSTVYTKINNTVYTKINSTVYTKINRVSLSTMFSALLRVQSFDHDNDQDGPARESAISDRPTSFKASFRAAAVTLSGSFSWNKTKI